MKPGPDEEEVYQGLCHVFWGPASEIRKQKKIEQRLRLCQEPDTYNPDAVALVAKYQFNPVVVTCKKLLEAGIFENRQKAKERFPGIFHPILQPTAIQKQVEDKMEAEASTTNPIASAIPDTMAKAQPDGQRGGLGPVIPNQNADASFQADTGEKLWFTVAIDKNAQKTPSVTASVPQSPATSLTLVPSLPRTRPTRLSYEAQHILLVKTQEILEKAFFGYAEKNMRRILYARQWHVPECGELQVWARIFKLEAKVRFKAEGVPYPHRNWNSFFESISQIRHKAVHREQIVGSDVEAFLRDAESLARLLRDDEGAQTLAKYREETRTCLETFEFCKKKLSTNFQTKVDDITARRAELDRLERQAKQDLLQEEKEMQAKLGSHLKEKITILEAPQTKGAEGNDNEYQESNTLRALIASSCRNLLVLCRLLYRG